jgi:hypothetical protein
MSVATDLNDTEQVDLDGLRTPSGSVPTVKLDITNNWTGVNELPFEVIAERELEIEAEGEKGPMSVRFGKPVLLEGMGWACVFQMSALGRVHTSPARGMDAVEALQAAFGMVHRQLEGMRRRHRITFEGGEDLGFAAAADAGAVKAQGCPVMNGTMGV